MKVDYIIVGLGLAGLTFAEKLKQQNKSFVVFENNSQNSSKVAAGMFNPVVLKRFTAVWKGEEQLGFAKPIFQEIEKRFQKKYLYDVDIYRVFKSVEEQNNWFAKCDNPVLSNYMTTPIIKNDNSEVIAPFDYGRLTNTGKLDVHALLMDYITYLEESKQLFLESFKHDALQISKDSVSYKDIQAKKIVFCEGYGIKDNPYFSHLPLNEAKGELITIHAPKLAIDFLLKAAVFVLPIGEDLYKVGATFNWKDKTQIPSKEGKEELINKLKTTINTPYTIVDHVAGIRPTVKDRRPLIGSHSVYKNVAILNGLGTRGVMLAPTMAHQLFEYLENNLSLDKEVDIRRFD